jgi:ATP synthase protein I
MPNNHKFEYQKLYAKYIGLTFQMIILIVLGGFGGRALDSYFQNHSPYFTIALIMLAAFVSFFLFFKAIFTK